MASRQDNTCWSCQRAGRHECTCTGGVWICNSCWGNGGWGSKVCGRCGGNGDSLCRRCGGAGYTPCRKCGETGTFPPRPGVVHRVVTERRDTERRRAEERHRRAEEQAEERARERAEEEARKQAKEERYAAWVQRRKQIQRQREARSECMMCGDPLGYFEKLIKRRKHWYCREFQEVRPRDVTRS